MDATRSETLTFTYDELDRLDTVSGPYSHNYDYNSIGNITSKNTATYTYGNAAHKHAVTALSTGESYSYDANGNMITRVEGGLTYTQTFDAENRLISVTVSGQTTQFVYDGAGNLIKKIKPDGSRTLYVGGVYEVDKTSGGSVTRTVTYYPAAGAMRIDSTLYYVLKDHLGSASVVTDASGNTVGEQRYYPFGETRLTTGTIYTDRLFTGQREITGLGIYHYNARFYSPKLGRFLSADTIIPSYTNPQALNRYSYVLNDPIRYTDPTGNKYCDSESEGDCSQYSSSIEHTARKYRIRFKGKWKVKDQVAVLEAVEATGAKAASERQMGETAAEAFEAIYDPITMVSVANYEYQGNVYEDGCKTEGSTVTCADITYVYFQSTVNNIVHELGHVFDPGSGIPQVFIDHRGDILHANDQTGMWQQNTAPTSGETFADFFVAWVFGVWGPEADRVWEGHEDVGSAKHWMTTNMADWLHP